MLHSPSHHKQREKATGMFQILHFPPILLRLLSQQLGAVRFGVSRSQQL